MKKKLLIGGVVWLFLLTVGFYFTLRAAAPKPLFADEIIIRVPISVTTQRLAAVVS